MATTAAATRLRSLLPHLRPLHTAAMAAAMASSPAREVEDAAGSATNTSPAANATVRSSAREKRDAAGTAANKKRRENAPARSAAREKKDAAGNAANRKPRANAPARSAAKEKKVAVGSATNTKPLYRRLAAVRGAGDGGVAQEMDKWVGEGRKVRARELIECVKELRKYGRHSQALELTDWMITKDMNNTSHAIRLELIYKVRGVEAAEEYFANLPVPAKNESTHGALLYCYCSQQMEEKATALYRKMDEVGIFSSTLAINNLMSLYMKLGQHRKVANLYQEMKVKNVAPNNLTCCILMTSHAAVGKIDSVEEVIREMEEQEDVTLGWSAYSTVASIYINAGLTEKAEAALKKLEGLADGRDGMLPFDFLISLYTTAGNMAEVNRVWNLVKATFPKVSNTTYLVMLQALYKLSDVERMKQIFEDWESNRASYDVKLPNMMIRAYLRDGMTKEAELIWGKAKEKGAAFDSKTCRLFLDHYMEKCEANLALDWVENMTKLSKKVGKLDQETIYKLLQSFQEQKDVERAEKLCNCLRTLRCIDGRAYESLLRTYLAAGKNNSSLRRQIKEDNIEICYDIGKLLKRMSDNAR